MPTSNFVSRWEKRCAVFDPVGFLRCKHVAISAVALWRLHVARLVFACGSCCMWHLLSAVAVCNLDMSCCGKLPEWISCFEINRLSTTTEKSVSFVSSFF